MYGGVVPRMEGLSRVWRGCPVYEEVVPCMEEGVQCMEETVLCMEEVVLCRLLRLMSRGRVLNAYMEVRDLTNRPT